MKQSKKQLQWHSASISTPFILLLVLASLLLMSWYQIQKMNYLQHELLQDTYRLKLMLELTALQLQSSLQITNQEMTYLDKVSFNCGEVRITWDEPHSCFHLRAELSNQEFREETIVIRIQDIQK